MSQNSIIITVAFECIYRIKNSMFYIVNGRSISYWRSPISNRRSDIISDT